MRFDKYFLGLVVSCLSSAGVFAADYDINNDTVLVETYGVGDVDWNGFYVGVMAGYGAGDTVTTALNGPFTKGQQGGILGGTLGLNYQVDQFVLGVEGDVSWSDIGAEHVVGGRALSYDLVWSSTLRGRLGVAFENVLFYGTAGVAVGGVKTNFSPAQAGFPSSDTQTHVGWTAGIGGEYALTDNIRLKAEYSYTDLGSGTNPTGSVGPGPLEKSSTFHAVKAGLNFAF